MIVREKGTVGNKMMRSSEKLKFIMDEHGDQLLRFCTLLLGSPSESEKVLFKAALKATKRWQYFENQGEERVWFMHIVVSVCKNQHLRNLIKANRKVLPMMNEGNILVRKIKELPFFCKVIFLLYFYFGFTENEIVRISNIPVLFVHKSLSSSENQFKEI